jgi:tetratricopeptide (TPR) repeat protein
MFKDAFSFHGRIRGTEYGISFSIAVIALLIIKSIAETSSDAEVIYLAYIPLYWFLFAQGAKRSHDLDNSGWWQVIPFYALWLIFEKGSIGTNRYGNDPKIAQTSMGYTSHELTNTKQKQIYPDKSYGEYYGDYNDRGIAKYKLLDFTGAIHEYTKAINIYPNDYAVFFNRGMAKSSIEDYSGSVFDFTKAIELNPNDSSVYNYRGIAKFNLEDYRGALYDYTKAIEANPNEAVYYYNRGLVKVILNQSDSGCIDFSRAGELGYAKAYIEIKKNCHK